MKVENTREGATSFVPTLRRRIDGHNDNVVIFCVRMSAGIVCVCCYSRGSKEGRDHSKYVRVTLRGIAKPGCVDQNDATTVEIKSLRYLYGVGARSQLAADTKAGPTDEVDEL